MTEGTCAVCGNTYTKRGMTRHLRSCLSDLPATDEGVVAHIRITATHRPDYWLHLGVTETTTVDTLDAFLRELWLECCGHMSAFTISDVQYTKPYIEDEETSPFGVDDRSMDVPFATLLDTDEADRPEQEFTYEYDFGTTTELTLRVVETGGWDLVETDITGDGGNAPRMDGIHLLARNSPPEIECGECDAPATVVCQECLYERGPDAWLCDDCADAHETECEYSSFLPKINSPRTGVCGYTGRSSRI